MTFNKRDQVGKTREANSIIVGGFLSYLKSQIVKIGVERIFVQKILGFAF